MVKKLKFGLLALPVIALSVLALAGTAAAGLFPNNPLNTAQDPQTANIPYLAWAGNQVRIAKCFDEDDLRGEIVVADHQLWRGKFRVEDWSGYELTGGGTDGSVNTRQRTPDPQFLNDADGDVVGQFVVDEATDTERLCFAVHVSSLKPGLAIIKLAVREDLLGEFPGLDVLGKHQFVVIWLRSQAPTIKEVRNTDFPDIRLGDSTGNGIFNLGDDPNVAPYLRPFGERNGLVQIDVDGTFPMGNDFAGQWAGDSVKLPDQWKALAEAYAFDDEDSAGGIPGSAPMRWDIHDDKTPYSPHAGANACTPRSGSIDAVDNCLGGPQDGQFSFYYGYSQPAFGDGNGPDAAVGPFDQIRPLNSLLSDNKLDQDDAPMPPIRVDVRIAAGGVGGLEAADKDDIYVRDQSKPDSDPHNLYAPFYEALIPASVAGDNGQTSGVAGSFTNNFPGFQTNYYDYWDLANQWVEDPLRDRNICRDSAGNTLTSPQGYDHVAVYTDEHGEAIVAYNPDTGYHFATLNGACDLDAPANRTFTSLITATAIYPDQPVAWDRANKTSTSLTKVTNIAASKVLNCVPKGDSNMFCVETVRDIYGDLQSGVDVSFTRSPQGLILPDTTAFGGFDTSDQKVQSATSNEVVVRTGPKGQAGVLIRETRNICVDVTAHNLGSRQLAGGSYNPGVFRRIFINPSAGTILATCGDGTGGGGPLQQQQQVTPVVVPAVEQKAGTTTVIIQTAAPTTSASTAATSTAASVVSLAGNPTPAAALPEKATPAAKAAAKAKAARATLASAQLMSIKGTKYLVLRLKSAQNSAMVRITLVGKNGKAIKVVVRDVATNRMVIVPNLKFGKAVMSVKVSVV